MAIKDVHKCYSGSDVFIFDGNNFVDQICD